MLAIDLTGRAALVTGATGELGRVITRVLSGCGADADVVIHYHRNRDRANALQQEIVAGGGRATVVQADVTDNASVARMREQVAPNLGGGSPDIVVTNAVIQYAWASVLEPPLEDFDGQYRSCVAHNVLMGGGGSRYRAGLAPKWSRKIHI